MVTSWMKRNPALTVCLVFLFSVCVRLVTAEYVDIGGDNVWRWTSALDVIQGVGFPEWTHHNMRWSVMAPLWLSMKVFGTGPATYYVSPIFFASLGATLIFLIGRRLHSVECGIVAALLVIFLPQMPQTGSQNWPSVFQFTYIAVSIWAILKRHEEKKEWLLALAALAFVFAWGARLTALYYFPGLLLMVWLPRRDYKGAFIFCLAVGVFLGCEWLYFWQDTGNIFGRIGIIKTATLAIDGTPLVDYLLNGFKLTRLRGLMPVYIIIVFACIALLRSRSREKKSLALFYLIFIFMFSYMVSGFDPIRLAQDLSRRYWCMVAPFGLLILAIALYDAKDSYPRFAKGVLMILLVVFIAFSAKKIPAGNALIQVEKDHAVLTPVFEARQPILLKWQPWQPNWIESMMFKVAGVKKSKKPDLHSVLDAMVRGGHRALGLYSPTSRDFYTFKRSWFTQLDDLTYRLDFPDGDPNAEPAAVIDFDRRWASAKRLP
ncbi:glycosyltransferase family 39 protein [uncultured Pseudodesulfovibrio sp.]|uniref:ArnT family glycosyltransferase n=1 Tax=uncultured Pseudodesulfovibrio sp. TaxID=2035858 RepID=UPI0029C83DDE|nr:glycosyltransferase family 39 protein [uncultured Pseudodesulfovibrio sp.]